MAYAMTKRGSLDNCITYEFMCDTVEDMNQIGNEYRTLGSVAIVLNGESGSLEVYITDSSKEWHNFSSAGSGSAAEGAGLKLHLCASDEISEGLPDIASPDENTIYLVPNNDEDNNLYDEYFYIDDNWEKFGSASVDLSGYYQKPVTGIPASDLANGVIPDTSIYAPVNSPNFTGRISMGRKAGTTAGANSVAEGYNVTASGAYSHAEGQGGSFTDPFDNSVTIVSGARGRADHTEGYNTATDMAYGLDNTLAGNHAEGNQTIASGGAAHAEGTGTKASGTASHAEGHLTLASGRYGAHAEGEYTLAIGDSAHAEGNTTRANVPNSHAEGKDTQANGDAAHAEGKGGTFTDPFGDGTKEIISMANGYAAHSEGYQTFASGSGSHSEGRYTYAFEASSHAEGDSTRALSVGAHAEGQKTQAIGLYSHAEGQNTLATVHSAHAEGDNSQARAQSGHAEGSSTISSGYAAHSEGGYTSAIGQYSHAEGEGGTYTLSGTSKVSQSTGRASHTEGYQTRAISQGAHAEGHQTEATAQAAHSEGNRTLATQPSAHAEGEETRADGSYSHAEGHKTVALKSAAHAEGDNTIAVVDSSHVQGKYNIKDSYDSWPEWVADTSYEVGDKVKRTITSNDVTNVIGYICETANSDATFTSSNWVQDQYMNYADIVGNGTYETRSNASALDWDGNLHLMGDLYVGCNADSTGGIKIPRIPSAPTADGTYTLQVTVTNGIPTYSWVSAG